MVDLRNWVNKVVKNPTKSLCPFIRTETDTETKIIPRQPEEVPRQKNRESDQIDKYTKKSKV